MKKERFLLFLNIILIGILLALSISSAVGAAFNVHYVNDGGGGGISSTKKATTTPKSTKTTTSSGNTGTTTSTKKATTTMPKSTKTPKPGTTSPNDIHFIDDGGNVATPKPTTTPKPTKTATPSGNAAVPRTTTPPSDSGNSNRTASPVDVRKNIYNQVNQLQEESAWRPSEDVQYRGDREPGVLPNQATVDATVPVEGEALVPIYLIAVPSSDEEAIANATKNGDAEYRSIMMWGHEDREYGGTNTVADDQNDFLNGANVAQVGRTVEVVYAKTYTYYDEDGNLKQVYDYSDAQKAIDEMGFTGYAQMNGYVTQDGKRVEVANQSSLMAAVRSNFNENTNPTNNTPTNNTPTNINTTNNNPTNTDIKVCSKKMGSYLRKWTISKYN